jgi:hypothetical protein
VVIPTMLLFAITEMACITKEKCTDDTLLAIRS